MVTLKRILIRSLFQVAFFGGSVTLKLTWLKVKKLIWLSWVVHSYKNPVVPSCGISLIKSNKLQKLPKKKTYINRDIYIANFLYFHRDSRSLPSHQAAPRSRYLSTTAPFTETQLGMPAAPPGIPRIPGLPRESVETPCFVRVSGGIFWCHLLKMATKWE